MDVTEDENTDEEYFSPSDAEDSDGNKKLPKIIMYCKYTHYEVVKEAGKCFMEFHLTKKHLSDWDIAWFDGPIGLNFLRDMNSH